MNFICMLTCICWLLLSSSIKWIKINMFLSGFKKIWFLKLKYLILAYYYYYYYLYNRFYLEFYKYFDELIVKVFEKNNMSVVLNFTELFGGKLNIIDEVTVETTMSYLLIFYN